ncbi:MAG: hypothetical protein HW416_3552, partial [Chloroflexi bacterium]|nr:hypothetical protein [Chloroflexota bacterium]
EVLTKADGLNGSAADQYLPRTYGLLGTAYFWTGNRESARTYTVKARNYCERINDLDGVAIYSNNLAQIDGAA